MSDTTSPDKTGAIGILVLAAGASTRLGEPKQLLRFEGQTLIRRAAETACALRTQEDSHGFVPGSQKPLFLPMQEGVGSGKGPIVVLGANAERIRPELDGLPVSIIFNPDWQSGMASSLRAGLSELQPRSGDVRAVLLLLSDQPLVTRDALARLVSAYRASSLPLAAAEYAGIAGVPAIFHRAYFPHLQALQGDAGARRVLQAHSEAVCRVPLPEAAFDIDTPEAVSRLQTLSS